jgi:hypothetical protein
MIILRKPFFVGGIKGATAYEFQIWRFGIRYIHLKSTKFGNIFNFFKRISFHLW